MMNIDVKNALDKVLVALNTIEAQTGISLVQSFAGDIYSFIFSISKSNCDGRYERFNNLYLSGEHPSAAFRESNGSALRTLDMLSQVFASNPVEGNRLANIIIAFFLVLGRYYLSSQCDRNEVQIDAVTSQIKYMKDFIRATIDTSNGKSQSAQEFRYSKENEASVTEQKCETAPIKANQNGQGESLEELLEQLNTLIGLNGVKQEVQQIVNLIRVQKKGEEFGVKLPPLSLHLVFFGNPGTGKTTVARLLAKIYKNLGVLSSGQLVEVDRGGLVAGYVGQTAIKTQEVIEKAMGGILFIDEAYALTHAKGDNDFGQEAVDTILKAMEDHRDDFIVIVAGYPDLMKEFISSNPGLKSRFNQYISFEDYTPEELRQIFLLLCNNQGFTLDEGCNDYLTQYFINMYENRSANYANGRDVRNYFEKVIRARANRLSPILETVSHKEYILITERDLQEAARDNKTF